MVKYWKLHWIATFYNSGIPSILMKKAIFSSNILFKVNNIGNVLLLNRDVDGHNIYIKLKFVRSWLSVYN